MLYFAVLLRSSPLVLALPFAFGLFSACLDPVETERIDSLGPEKAGERPGPLHRGGQPCLVCHTDGGRAQAFSVAGTVYATQSSGVPVGDVVVTIIDAAGQKVRKRSNCAGNFYAGEQKAALAFPLHAEIECTLPDGSTKRSVMGTRIDRDGSCATCHFGKPSVDGPGRVGCAVDMPVPPFEKPIDCTEGGRG